MVGSMAVTFILAPSSSAARSAAGASWGPAISLLALNGGRDAAVNSLSCAPAGDCTIGGGYVDRSGHQQAFVTTRANGRWGPLMTVPGTDALNKGNNAEATGLSCPLAGGCTVFGSYKDSSNTAQWFADSEKNGHWSTAIPLSLAIPLSPGNTGNIAISGIDCASAGNCALGGGDETSYPASFAWVMSETNGHWGKAMVVPGTSTNPGTFADVTMVSCAPGGNCAAAGDFMASSASNQQAFVAGEKNGHWGNAIVVPGTGRLNKGTAAVQNLSCPATGDCTVLGYYSPSRYGPTTREFVDSESNGHWGQAVEAPFWRALTRAGNPITVILTCPSAGNCTVAGTVNGRLLQGFVVSEKNGRWGTVILLSSPPRPRERPYSLINSVFCTSAGNCVAGGLFTYRALHAQDSLVLQRNGVWGQPIGIPGLAALSTGGHARVDDVSCSTAGKCAAIGFYPVKTNGVGETFVAAEG
jgi:hypothetical protein